jgi:hypothetical protein
MRNRIAAALGAATLTLPVLNGVAEAMAVASKKTSAIVTRQVVGPLVKCDRWGYVQVTLVVRKTTTTVGTRKKITRRIVSVRVPQYPKTGAPHTIALNARTIPVLAQQVMKGQLATRIQVVAEATDTSIAFDQSLQAAILKARKI